MLKAAAAEVAKRQSTSRLSNAAKSLNGIFAVNKPPGISCTGLLDYFKRNIGRNSSGIPFAAHYERENELRKTGKKVFRRKYQLDLRVGHGGTLDVEAAGVLLVGIDKGCKLLNQYLTGGKTYMATGRMGVVTDTRDAEGKILEIHDTKYASCDAVQQALPQFIGDINQVPPVYSALKVDGKRLYEYARKGEPILDSIRSRKVHVEDIRLLYFNNSLNQHWGQKVALPDDIADYFVSGRYQWDSRNGSKMQVGDMMAPYCNSPDLPVFQLLIKSGGGVYVRSLIHDLGVQLGCGAFMASLVRIAQGPLRLDRDTINPEDLPYIDRVMNAIRHTENVIAKNRAI
ncbi:pseudouridine synthase pus4 [Coemansia sp. RSA 1290]|nr:pseudouridine synthase pus4 [Coemansia sp. RSA 1086]KAJ1748628.1 pseudouridine synthase pus4 [Coemansia sp. RSA 1821]KAJ2633386.1 pseudouridine synthase pus4 [Coemansia sp. RSA 1290]KAJ2653077.1 pseudouridine synthase pus4 [Coemansia sp. RSA 1250]KAJ2676077.1 pseudouridine synthase pus4 [Coemansia sp. RSA 1085]